MCLATVQAQTTNNTSTNTFTLLTTTTTPSQTDAGPDKQVMLSPFLLGLGVSIVLGWTVWQVWRVSCKIPNERVACTLTLEKSYDHATWYPIRTNIGVALQGTKPVEFFRANMEEDPTAFYRVKVEN